jgi:hypothetical protein
VGISEVVGAGQTRASLEAVRDRLALLLEDAPARDAAALARQLTIVLEKIDKLPGGEEASNLDRIAADVTDELAARREAR